jgi:hypothetical protein
VIRLAIKNNCIECILMKMKLLVSALLSTACFVGAAQASTVNLDIDLVVITSDTGNFVGNISTLTLTYDTADITMTNNSLTAVPQVFFPGFPAGPGFDFSFSNLFGFGQTFTDFDDPNAILSFDNAPNSDPTNLILAISETEPGANVGITNPNVFGFATLGTLFTATAGNPTIGVRVFDRAAVTVSPVPVPASALLLGTALLGAGAVSRRRRRKS